MIDLTIKTLDSQNHAFSVPDDLTVKELKERIAPSVGITADKQRLIYCGRVLQDDKKLQDCDVNGKVVHLVQRAPPSNTPSLPNPPPPPINRRANGAGIHFRPGHVYINAAMGGPQNEDPNANGRMVVVGTSSAEMRINTAINMMERATRVINQIEGLEVPPTTTTSNQENNATTDSAVGSSTTSSTSASSSTTSVTSTSSSFSQSIPPMTSSQPLRAPIDMVTMQAAHAAQAATAATIAAALSAVRMAGGIPMMSVDHNPTNPGSSVNVRIVQRPRAPTPSQTTATQTNTTQTTIASNTTTNPTPSVNHPTVNGNATVNGTTTGNGNAPPANGNSPPPVQYPRSTVLADALGTLIELTNRLSPHVESYQRLLREDPTFDSTDPPESVAEANRLASMVPQSLHYLSHALHALSDITYNLERPAPRDVRARPVMVQHSAVLHAEVSIPVPVSMSSTSTPTVPQSSPQSGTPSSASITPPPPLPTAIPSTQTLGSNPEMFTDASGNPGFSINLGGGFNPRTNPRFPSNPPQHPIHLNPNVLHQLMNPPSNIMVMELNAEDGSIEQVHLPRAGTTNPTTATHTRSTPTPHVPAQTILTGNPCNQFDLFLQCSSHHLGQQQQTRPMMGAFQQGLNVAINMLGAQQRPVRFPAPTPAPTAPRADVPPVPQAITQQVMEGLTRMLQQHAAPVAASGSSTSTSSTGDSPDNITTDAIFQQIARALLGQLSNTDGPPASIASFLTSVVDQEHTEGESFMMDLIMCIARELTFQDMIAIMAGNHNTLNNLRPTLKNFLSAHLYNGNTRPDPQLILQAAQGLANDTVNHLERIAEVGTVRTDIDYVATMHPFLCSELETLLTTINSHNDSSVEPFGAMLISSIRLLESRVIALNMLCFAEGQRSLDVVVRSILNGMIDNQSIQQWTFATCLSQMQNVSQTVVVNPEQVEAFLVDKEKGKEWRENREKTRETDSTPMDVDPDVVLVDRKMEVPITSGTITSAARDGVKVREIPHNIVPDRKEEWHSTVPAVRIGRGVGGYVKVTN